jgi:hypothetical protein
MSAPEPGMDVSAVKVAPQPAKDWTQTLYQLGIGATGIKSPVR